MKNYGNCFKHHVMFVNELMERTRILLSGGMTTYKRGMRIFTINTLTEMAGEWLSLSFVCGHSKLTFSFGKQFT